MAFEIENGVSEGISPDDAVVNQDDVFGFDRALDRVKFELDSYETFFLSRRCA
jgi:hypothetical protein